MNRKRFGQYAKKGMLVLASALFFLSVSSAQDNWYEKTKTVYRDPYSFNETYIHLLFPTTGVRVGGREPYLYAILSKSKRDEIWSKANHAEVIDSRDLKPSEVKTFHDFFANKSDAVQMPYWVGGIGLIPLKVTNLVGAASTLIDILLNLADNSAGRTKASELAATMEVGGKFDRFFAVSDDQAGHEYLNSSIVYTVKVGNQVRSAVISSITYALKIE